MKFALILATLATSALVAWTGFSSRVAAAPALAANPAQSTAALYASNCAKCHGADGRAQTPRGKSMDAQDFTNAKWKSHTSATEAASTIRDGYQDMPAYKKRLTDPQIQALAEYVKGFPR